MNARRLLSTLCIGMTMALVACSTSPTDRPIGLVINDAAISTKVKAAFAADPTVKATDVQVETFKGVVQLSGFVDSPEQVTRALDMARRVEGVQDVKNAIIVKK